MTRSSVDYSRLRTISDVRAEQRRVNIALDYSRRRLEERWENLSELLTFDYWLDVVSRRVAEVTNVFTGAISGVSAVASLFRRAKR